MSPKLLVVALGKTDTHVTKEDQECGVCGFDRFLVFCGGVGNRANVSSSGYQTEARRPPSERPR
jgi:hypothetical protein